MTRIGFDNEKYLQLQTQAISSVIDEYQSGRLYLEIGGKYLFDPHASRVLPGYEPDNKVTIIRNLGIPYEIIVCFNASDITSGRVWDSKNDYQHSAFNLLSSLQISKEPKATIAINLYKEDPEVDEFISRLQDFKYSIFKRYFIDGYPDEVKHVVSEHGYGKDEFAATNSKLVLVIGLGSNSGKMSTALGQIYHERQVGYTSGYAKFESFPVWQLDVEHPTNLAYAAATADIKDEVIVDPFHFEATGITATNYNRDVEAFPILKELIIELTADDHPMRKYVSPTTMGINKIYAALVDHQSLKDAAISEIKYRIDEYQKLIPGKPEASEWVESCKLLLHKAEQYQL